MRCQPSFSVKGPTSRAGAWGGGGPSLQKDSSSTGTESAGDLTGDVFLLVGAEGRAHTGKPGHLLMAAEAQGIGSARCARETEDERSRQHLAGSRAGKQTSSCLAVMAVARTCAW